MGSAEREEEAGRNAEAAVVAAMSRPAEDGEQRLGPGEENRVQHFGGRHPGSASTSCGKVQRRS